MKSRPGLVRSLFAAAVGLAVVVACSSSTLTPATGQFTGPLGLAITSGGDRDLLFVSSSGADEVRALQMCTTPHLADGGVDPSDTCPSREDFQFLAGPVRIFPATINVVERPVRMAGARLCAPGADGGCGAALGGVAVVTGTESRIAIVDARYLVDAANHRVDGGTADGGAVRALAVESPAVDVATVSAYPDAGSDLELSAVTGRAYLVLRPQAATPARIVALDLSLDANGYANNPVRAGTCDLPAGVDPRRLAMAKGDSTALYVADGAGDGAVRVDTASVVAAGGACATQRISFGNNPLRSVAVNPEWRSQAPDGTAVPQPAGTLLAGVTTDGGVLFASTVTKQLVPVPSVPIDSTDTTVQRMDPMNTAGQGQDLNPLRATTPPGSQMQDIAFLGPDRCPAPPCQQVFVGPTSPTPTTPAGKRLGFNLLAVASSTDGAGYFIDVQKRRFLNNLYFQSDKTLIQPKLTVTPVATDIVPAPADPATPGHRATWWLNAGVTRNATWLATWHGVIPGLDRRGGTATLSADGKSLTIDTGASFAPWLAPPVSLRAGDVVSLYAYFDTANTCPDVHAETPLRFELPITAISSTQVTLATTSDFSPNPATCKSFGVVGEFRTAADKPWLLVSNGELRGRVATGDTFVAMNRRFDYPLDYDTGGLALDANREANVEIAFQIVRTNPVIGTQVTLATGSSQSYTSIVDPGTAQGLAGTILPYTSPKVLDLTFMALPGSNGVLQGDPANLGSSGGVIAYR